jgi:alpha-L-fucosidase 2
MTRLASLLTVAGILAAAASLDTIAQQTVALSSLTLQAPIDTWDEALPLGNGLIGALLWGKDNVIRLSLDRGDLWDLRLPEIYSRPDWNYQTMQRLKAEGNQAEMHRLFDIPYDTIPYPTKLPAGRVEIALPAGLKAGTFELDLRGAEGRCRFGTVTLKAFVAADSPVVLVWVPAPEFTLSVAAPTAVAKLGYSPGTALDRDGFSGYVQDGALGLRYGVLARTQTSGDGSLVAITVFASKDGTDPLPAARTTLTSALAAGYERMFQRHARWWTSFWATSSVTIPEARLQRHYDLVKYFYGAASRRNAPPIPLQGVWTADNGNLPPWKGDYHHDLNTQTTYIAYQTAGLFDAGESFLGFMSGLLPQFQKFARDFYGVDGAVVPGVMTLAGKAMGGWGQYSLSPTNGAWVSHLFVRHWRYTRDPRFLETEAYPFCRAIAGSLAGLLREDRDGYLRLPLSTSPEIFDNSMEAWLPPMSNYDLALVRTAFMDLAELETARHQTADAKTWTALAGRLPPDRVDPATNSLMFADGLPYSQSHRHFSHAMAVHPLGQYDISRGADDRRVINGTIDAIARHGSAQWVGYSFSWFSNMLARAGRAEESLRYLRTFERSFTLRNGFHVNGEQTREGLSNYHYRPFTLEGNFLAMEAVHEMLLQSHGGVIRLFPATSAEWQDASFDRLRAEGGFIVSAERKSGKTVSFSITATVDHTLTLRDPFGGGGRFVRPIRRENDDIVVELKKGETFGSRLR